MRTFEVGVWFSSSPEVRSWPGDIERSDSAVVRALLSHSLHRPPWNIIGGGMIPPIGDIYVSGSGRM